MGKFFCILLLFLQVYSLQAQQIPVYNHYYSNPYLYNPAEAGGNGFINVSLNHRQQWRGIEGAPVVSTLTFEAPLGKSSLGLSVRNYKRGLITTNDILASYAYNAFLSKNTSFHLGLSAGVTNTDINLDQIDDPGDPILSKYKRPNMQPIGNFGFSLKAKNGINISVALPKLFQTTFINSENFESYKFSPFDEVLFVGYYKKRLDKRSVTRRVRGVRRRVLVEDSFAPLQMYFLYKYSTITDERMEILATLHLHENFWLGGAYRLNYGASGLVGFNISSLAFSYAYEPANTVVEGYAQGTHEVQLTINIGPRKKHEYTKPDKTTSPKVKTPPRDKKPKATVDKKIEKKEEVAPVVEEKKKEAPPVVEEKKEEVTPVVEEKEVVPVVEEKEEEVVPVVEEEKEKVIIKKYYVVIKSFDDYDSADEYILQLEGKGIIADVFFNSADKKYHVYSSETEDLQEANEQKKAIQEKTTSDSVSIITVEQEQ